ncbi:alpha-2-macroglobulin [Dyadobacter subterraneus]|uniref:Alpha-2-macroglobulin n=1 Tax=Dyadobacter subterraneus TaxID=2773304 RepID=A0ABR9WHY6_9BACT|nr:alpha-2-macroglobulin family protein [Dyadobacter subterraneus]MBE9465133.1 alpha-2-macroglobulin [Dyadobacter subterraneus]
MKLSTSPVLFSFIVILCFFSKTIRSQNLVKTYEVQWKNVANYTDKGLSQSALAEVKKIYQLAKKENQEAQIIKAVVYMIDLQSENRENAEIISIQELEKEINSNKEPAKSILTSLLAKKYYQYYQQIRWQLYNRTATQEFKKEDIATWTTEDFHQKISSLYLRSISQEKLLKQTALEGYNAIITKGNVRKLRPTLYDLLAQEALAYFSTDERNIKKPTYSFEINSASAYDPAADFIHRKFETKDTTSLEFYTLKLYQKLIAFHINDKTADALIDIDLQRLQYVKQKSVHPDSDELYFMSVRHLADQYQNTPAAAQAWYLTALWHYENGVGYQANQDTTNRLEKVKAIEICNKIIKQNSKTEGGVNALNLMQTIQRKSLQYTTENVNIPEKPFRMLVEYQNINRLYLRIIRSTEEMKIKISFGLSPENLHLFTTATSIRSWEQNLPDTKDYQEHSLEIKVDALPVGEYFILVADNPIFQNPKTLIGLRQLYISNITYAQNGDDLFLLNRDTGQPLSQAKVRIWQTRNDRNGLGYLKLKSDLFVADYNGYLKRKKLNDTQNPITELLEITHENDKLFMQKEAHTYYRYSEEETPMTRKTYLFTDRSIYRPGQMVYYKGIVTNSNASTSQPDIDTDIPVILKNTNWEEVEKTIVRVNDFGGFSGKFQLPTNTLNGAFSLYVDENSSVTIYVEDYKRPKFAIAFDSLKTTYKLNDSIRINGAAIAYAGNTIDAAKVSYRVVRNTSHLYNSYDKHMTLPSFPVDITHGEITTAQSGKFSIAFQATPDLKISKNIEPIFHFTIHANVTDSNGETRSEEITVSVGYKSIILKTDISDKIQTDTLKNFAIRTENMNGVFTESDVKIKMIRLMPENRLIRERLWKRPDLFVMSKAEFISLFPNDEYDNESDFENWPEQQVVFEKTKRLSPDKGFNVSETKFDAGFYKLEITAIHLGEEIKDIKFVEIIDPKSGKTNRPEYLTIKESNPIQPGEKTTFEIGSSANQVFVIKSSSWKEKGSYPYSFFSINNEKRIFEFSVTEADRRSYSVDYLFVKHNRIYAHDEVVKVPWLNKDLQIEYLTFRDKTLPGSKEKWKIKITGYKKEKVAAEMLASMYDTSLDQFHPNQWIKPDLWREILDNDAWNSFDNFSDGAAITNLSDYLIPSMSLNKIYDEFFWQNFGRIVFKGNKGKTINRNTLAEKVPGVNLESSLAVVQLADEQHAKMESPVIPDKPAIKKEITNNIRKNFSETAFFFPDLLTNEKGEIEFSFTMPEALTRWKFQALAHTKELALGYSSKEIITQKDLMVQPNAPRFLREGDKISFSSKVVNLADKELSGTVTFQLFDTETNQSVDEIFKNTSFSQSFILKGKESKTIQFPIEVPENFSKTLTWRIIAKSGSYSDGEENFLPVLSNRILVTETLPLSTKGNGSKNFKFEKLINSGNSKTLSNLSLSAEFTTNPAWYAVQALPYLAKSRFDCAEQIWNRYYANALAANIVQMSPRISKIFETWRTLDTTALHGNLQKNQELKSIFLEETPWVLAAKTENQQKKNIALLFDLNKISNDLQSNFAKLEQMQNPNGAFSWFKGGPDDRYMTQYILSGIGHLRKISGKGKSMDVKMETLMRKGIQFLDQKIKEDYDFLVKEKTDLNKLSAGPNAIQYLYMRSFFPEIEIPKTSQKAWNYFHDRAKLNWLSQSKYLQGLTALALFKTGEKEIAKAILKSLKETAITNEEMGMYWKSNQQGWWWYEAPVERQALLIEAFQEINQDSKTVNDLKTWLLKNKQTNNWESTKATAEACYALLLQGTDILNQESVITLNLGELSLKSTDQKQEAGTGYFKTIVDGTKIKPEMGNVKIEVNTNSSSNLPAWGAVYWQYFENADKVTSAETSLKLAKQLFIERNSDKGPVLSLVKEGDKLHVGDKINVRIELRADRDMEYVHMKDLRAAAFEPVNVLSGYKWKGGLGYYESTRDASTDFFFDHLRQGTYVFEYPLFVTHDGNFANGITNIECMYAPEFSGHSDGVRVEVGR